MNVRLTAQSERLLKEQLAHGNFRSPEEVTATESRAKNPAHALADILDRKGVTLGGIRIKNLTHERQI